MLPSQLRKKAVAAPSNTGLDTPEQVARSIERDQALIVQARRERDQIATDRDRFELSRDKIVFGFEFAGTLMILIALLAVVVTDPKFLPISLLSGSGVGGIGLLLRRRGHEA